MKSKESERKGMKNREKRKEKKNARMAKIEQRGDINKA